MLALRPRALDERRRPRGPCGPSATPAAGAGWHGLDRGRADWLATDFATGGRMVWINGSPLGQPMVATVGVPRGAVDAAFTERGESELPTPDVPGEVVVEAAAS